MLNQKKLSLLIAAGLAVSLSAFPVLADDAPATPPVNNAPAQHERKPRRSITENLETRLKLTDTQKTTVDPILADAQTQIDAIDHNRGLAREDKKAQILAIIEGLPDKLNPTLDTKQQAELARFVDRMKNPPARREHPKPAGDQTAPANNG